MYKILMKCLNPLAVYTRFVYNGLGKLLEGNTEIGRAHV